MQHQHATITRERYVDAVVPLMKALGLDPIAVFGQGFVLTPDRITGLTCVPPDGDAETDEFVAVGNDPNFAEKAWPFTIEVVGA